MQNDHENSPRTPDIGHLVPGFHFYFKIGESRTDILTRVFGWAGNAVADLYSRLIAFTAAGRKNTRRRKATPRR